MFWNSDSDAEQYVNDFQQVTSTDIYWFTEGDVCQQSQGGDATRPCPQLTAAECHRASNYGAQVDRVRFLDAMDGVRQPDLELRGGGHPFDNNMQRHRSIQPAEMRAAVWHSIIAGARGILYFQHSFGGSCIGDHHTIAPTVRQHARCQLGEYSDQIARLGAQLSEPRVGIYGEFECEGAREVGRLQLLRARRLTRKRRFHWHLRDSVRRERNGNGDRREPNGLRQRRFLRRLVR